MKTKAVLTTAAVLIVLAGLTVANLAAQHRGGPGAPDAGVQLTEADQNNIVLIRQEEKLARDVYLTLYELWGAEIFANIGESEQRHMDAVATLITRYGLTDPASDDTVGAFTNEDFAALYDQFVLDGSTSLDEALNVGVAVESLDIADLEDALEETSMRSVRRVFENLLNGSRNHLSAFQRTIETGTTVCPQQPGGGYGSCQDCPQCDMTGQQDRGPGGGGGQGGNGPR